MYFQTISNWKIDGLKSGKAVKTVGKYVWVQNGKASVAACINMSCGGEKRDQETPSVHFAVLDLTMSRVPRYHHASVDGRSSQRSMDAGKYPTNHQLVGQIPPALLVLSRRFKEDFSVSAKRSGKDTVVREYHSSTINFLRKCLRRFDDYNFWRPFFRLTDLICLLNVCCWIIGFW